MQVHSLIQEDPLERQMATYSSILAWKFPWTEEPGGLQSMGSQRVGHNLASEHIFVPTQDLHHYMVYKVIRIFCHLFLTVTLWVTADLITSLCFTDKETETQACSLTCSDLPVQVLQEADAGDLPGHPLVKNPPHDAWDAGSIPG